MMDPWTYSIMLSIFALWTLLASSCCSFGCDARSTTAIDMSKSQEPQTLPTSNPIKNAAENRPPPLCVYPPPTALPSPSHTPTPPSFTKPDHAVWCVAKTTVPAAQMQQALDYACGSGAECGPIQLNGPCYQPDTVAAHASYAFNTYWQKTKEGGGTCDFGGSAMLVTVDPSYDQCHFIYG